MTAAQNAAARIVATWEYEDERFGELRSPSHDADRLAQLLADAVLGGFDVEVLRNQGVLKVKRRIETFYRERARNDLTLLYFGHGVLDERNRYFIAAVDTDMDALASTGIDRDFVNARIEDCRSRRVAPPPRHLPQWSVREGRWVQGGDSAAARRGGVRR